MTTNNGSTQLISISAACNANNGGLSNGLTNKLVKATTTIKDSAYEILSVEFKKDINKYFCKLLASNGKTGTMNLKPDAKVSISSLVVAAKPETKKEEPKIEAIAVTPQPETKAIANSKSVSDYVEFATDILKPKTDTPKIDLSTLNAIATRLKADSEKIQTGSDEAIKAGQLLQRLECFKTDLLDYLFSTTAVTAEPVEVSQQDTTEAPKVKAHYTPTPKDEDVTVKPKAKRGPKPKSESAQKPEATQKPAKPQETKQDRIDFLNKLKTINKAVKSKTMTAAAAAEANGLPASSISAVLAGYRLAIAYKEEILNGYIKGEYSFNAIRTAGQYRNRLQENLIIAVATGKISIKEALEQAPKQS